MSTRDVLAEFQELDTVADLVAYVARHANGDIHHPLVDEFLRRYLQTMKRTAAGMLAQAKVDRATWADEFLGAVMRTAHACLLELIEDPQKLTGIQSFTGVVRFRASSAAQHLIKSQGAGTLASGAATSARRRRALLAVFDEMAADRGHHPSLEEVVAETNRRMIERRADAAHQGMICTLADFEQIRFVPLTDVSEEDQPAVVQSEAPLAGDEAVDLVALTLKACDAEGHVLGQVARLWFAMAADGRPNVSALARQLDLPDKEVRPMAARVRSIAEDIARNQFGLRGAS